MKLNELERLLLLSHLEGDGSVEFSGICMNSMHVRPGDLFICTPGIPGVTQDRHAYAADAVERGAVALVVEKDVPVDVPKLFVNNADEAAARIACYFHGYPSTEMKLIGVTGTNGKTTTSYLIESILRDLGYQTGLMGTVGMKIGHEFYEMKNTTQDALELQANLRRMRNVNTEYCVMEVSSHALDMGRVKGCSFRTALFTNLTQDHLDYHRTMERYRDAKGLLFARLGNVYSADESDRRYAILNADDPASEEFKRLTSAQVITYGIAEHADVRATDIEFTAEGTEFTVHCFAGNRRFRMKLVGRFNVYNALGAIAATLAEGVSIDAIANSLERVNVVDGRMELVREGQSFTVAVDYAHTPDGLENALTTVREFARGRVITVFGCGGDRDRTKRPMMGRIAAQYSDYVICTSDNPRTEDPKAILKDIEPGIAEGGKMQNSYVLIVDRREAIQKAVEMAAPEDVVLIAGKGHETYQIIGKETHDFDDRQVAREAIRRRKP
jgi:UDP-N-acetylmuramoyl-L-alanyl-D-glutamate--2,6-diaminopimelate ligase